MLDEKLSGHAQVTSILSTKVVCIKIKKNTLGINARVQVCSPYVMLETKRIQSTHKQSSLSGRVSLQCFHRGKNTLLQS